MSLKVSNVKSTDPERYMARATGNRGVSESEQVLFRRTLTDLTREAYTARLLEIKKKIDGQGSLLADKADVKEFEKYRSAIREFLDEIVSNGYAFLREDAYGARGRHRYIATVRIVDEKLDELGKEVMKEQADRIKIISKIDEIRGLLLDLMI